MNTIRVFISLLLAALALDVALAQTSPGPELGHEATPEMRAADRVAASIGDPVLVALVQEILERNPELAVLRARVRAAEQKAPQVRSLPDPMAGITPFLSTPETRVGPQEIMASVSQKIPWFGKLKLKEKAAILEAAVTRTEVEAKKLELVTESRRLYYELAFLDEWSEIVRLDRETLVHYEEIARARYESGSGISQSVIKIQAEITRAENKLLDIAGRRATVVAMINAMRDTPRETAIGSASLPDWGEINVTPLRWRDLAVTNRPEVEKADLEIDRASVVIDLAGTEYRPDFTFGLTYTLVGNREDPAGRMSPPPGNGDDILAVSATVNLPIWKRRLDAGVIEAVERRSGSEEMKRGVITRIDRDLTELAERIPLTWRQIELYERVLIIQAEESLDSAEGAYSAGSIRALDLLDAERVLLDVRTSTARSRADYAIEIVRLEGLTATPVDKETERETRNE